MKDSPQAPDPYKTAQAQTSSNLATANQQQDFNLANADRQNQYNLENAERQQGYNVTNAGTQNQYNRTNAMDAQRASMVDQSNPYGSTTYSQKGTNADGTPIYGVDTKLSQVGQALFDQNNALKSDQMGVAGQFLNGGEGAFSGKGPDLSYNGTTAALDKLNHARLDPQWADNTRHQEDTLFNRGIVPGTPAYDNAMRVFNEGKNDAYNSANLADYQTSSKNALDQWSAPMGAYAALTQGTAPQMPGQANVSTPGMSISNPNVANPNISNPNIANPNVAGTNVAGLISDNYKQESANANAQNGQMAGIFGSVLGAGANLATGGMSGTMGGLFGGGGGPSTGATMGAYGAGGGMGSGTMGGIRYPAF